MAEGRYGPDFAPRLEAKMRHKSDHDQRRARPDPGHRHVFKEPATLDPDDLPAEFDEGREIYGYDYGDYRDFEGRDPDADVEGGRGPGYEDESDARKEATWGGPDEYDSWRWASVQSWEPVGEWSTRHSHEFEQPGFGRRRARGRARRPDLARPATSGIERTSGRTGGFRGVAPKGYTRSDKAIYEDVCALLEDAEVDPSDVTVSVDDREVVLSGTVDDRWAKRYIEDLAYSVRDVSDVLNKLRIESREGEATLVAPGSRAREDVPDPY